MANVHRHNSDSDTFDMWKYFQEDAIYAWRKMRNDISDLNKGIREYVGIINDIKITIDRDSELKLNEKLHGPGSNDRYGRSFEADSYLRNALDGATSKELPFMTSVPLMRALSTMDALRVRSRWQEINMLLEDWLVPGPQFPMPQSPRPELINAMWTKVEITEVINSHKDKCVKDIVEIIEIYKGFSAVFAAEAMIDDKRIRVFSDEGVARFSDLYPDGQLKVAAENLTGLKNFVEATFKGYGINIQDPGFSFFKLDIGYSAEQDKITSFPMDPEGPKLSVPTP